MHLQNDSDLQLLVYLGMTNSYYGKVPQYITQGQDLFKHEFHFYHSTDPSSLVGWRTDNGVELRWTWDMRFVEPEFLEDEEPEGRVNQYFLLRKKGETGPETRLDVPLNNNYFTDQYGANGLEPDVSYSYRVFCVKDGIEYEYTPEDIACQVESGATSEIQFWPKRINFQEYALSQGTEDLDWEIAFRATSEPLPEKTSLEICYKYDPYNSSGEYLSSFIEDFSFENGQITFNLASSISDFRKYGGIAYRLRYFQANGDTVYYPKEQDNGRKHFYWSTINNRIIAQNWFNYKMRIEDSGKNRWRSRFIAMANELGSGVTPVSGEGSVAFDGIFVDSALETMLFNCVRPYEYLGPNSYSSASHEFLQVAAGEVTTAKLYPNPSSLEIMEAVEGYSGIGGLMLENWVQMKNLNQGFLRALWLCQDHPEWQVYFNHNGTDFNLDQSALNDRYQVFATFLATRNNGPVNETLFGFGGWKPDPDDINPAPDYPDRVAIFPEQMIQLGPSEDIIMNSPLPSAAEIMQMTAQSGADPSQYGSEAIQWIADNSTGYIESPSNGHKFIYRRTEHLEGDASETHYIWSIIDVSDAFGSVEVSLQDILGDKLTRSVVYRLELENDRVLLAEGGSFQCSGAMSTSDMWTASQGEAAIFFEVPVSTPTVSAQARFSLPSVLGEEAVLVVRASHWNEELLEIRIDGSSVGLPEEVFLNDEGLDGDVQAGDGYYTWTGQSQGAAAGQYLLPCGAIGTDGLRNYSKVSVDVVSETHTRYIEKSEDTNLNYPGQPYSSVPLDFDSVGPLDLFISFVHRKGELFFCDHLNPDSQVPAFDRAEASNFHNNQLPPIGLLGLAVADMDNDGDDDLFAASAEDPCLFVKESSGVFRNAIDDFGLSTLAQHSNTGSWADFDLDGQLDLFIGRSGIESGLEPSPGVSNLSDVLLKNDLEDNAAFLDFTSAAGITSEFATNCLTACWADVDSDGDQDLFVGQANEGNIGGPPHIESRLFINDGLGHFSEEGRSRLGASLSMLTHGAEFSDFNNDGVLDLVLSQHYTDSHVLLNNGNGYFPDVVPVDTGGLIGGVKAFDHNLNGKTDLLFLPDDPGILDNPNLPGLRPHLMGNFLDDAQPGFKDLTIQAGLQIQGKIGGCVVADFNGDGDQDLYLGKTVTSDEIFYKATSESRSENPYYHWLKVRLDSPALVNNSQGVGARVTVWINAVAHAQIVDGGCGRGGQNPAVLTFGLGTATLIDQIVVDWPNGHHQVIPGVGLGVDDELLITDSSELAMVNGKTSFTYKVNPGSNTVDWIFTYQTKVPTLGAFDKVEFDVAGLSGDCMPELTTLFPDSPNVHHSLVVMAGGTMKHQFVWTDRPCIPNCSVPYTVSSGLTELRQCSDDKLLKIKVCPVSSPTGGY